MEAIKTGKKSFAIPFDNGDKITLEFNPADFRFYANFKKLRTEIGKIFFEFEQRFKEVTGEKEVELFEETEKRIKTEFDKTFGDGAGDKIFKYCSPISFVEEDLYYPFYFIKQFEPEIANAISEKAKQSAERAKEIKEKMNSDVV